MLVASLVFLVLHGVAWRGLGEISELSLVWGKAVLSMFFLVRRLSVQCKTTQNEGPNASFRAKKAIRDIRVKVGSDLIGS